MSEGEFAGYIGSCIDITERRQAELEAAQQRNEMAHLARVTLLSELSGSLAHELNQPLGAIYSNAEAAEILLRKTPPDLDELRAILDDIRQDGWRAGEIIRRLRLLLRKGEVQLQLFKRERSSTKRPQTGAERLSESEGRPLYRIRAAFACGQR